MSLLYWTIPLIAVAVLLRWLTKVSVFGKRLMRTVDEDPDGWVGAAGNYRYGDVVLGWCYDHYKCEQGDLGIYESRKLRRKLEALMQDRAFKARQDERMKEHDL